MSPFLVARVPAISFEIFSDHGRQHEMHEMNSWRLSVCVSVRAIAGIPTGVAKGRISQLILRTRDGSGAESGLHSIPHSFMI